MVLPQTLNDFHGYYIQTIKWWKEHGVVKGLGNLHGRFAFNSYFLALSSIFSLEIKNLFGSYSFFVFPLNAAFLILFIKEVLKINNSNHDVIIKYFFCGIGLLSIVFFSKWIGTPSNDVAAGLATNFLILFFYKWHLFKEKRYVWIVSTIIFLSIVIKLSTILSILFLIPIIFYEKFNFKILLRISIIGFAILLPFFLKNILLSGYLIYPFPEIDLFNFIWKIPLELVISEKEAVYTWARIPGLTKEQFLEYGLFEWIPIWFDRHDILTKVILIINLFIPLSLIISIIRKEIFFRNLLLILIPNILFWFIQAPDPRFAFGYLFSSAVIVLIVIFKRKKSLSIEPITILYAGFFSIVVFYLFYQWPKIKSSNYYTDAIVFPVPIAKKDFNWIEMKNFKYKVPIDGSCSNLEIPCAPSKVKGLKLIGKDISQGFYLERNSD